MTCYHPLKGFLIPDEVTVNGKPKYKITDYRCDHIEKVVSGRAVGWTPVYQASVRPDALGSSYDYIEVACGKCFGCRLENSRQWAVRCVLESKRHTHNVFLTLTYEDCQLPVNVDGVNTLRKKDLQDFWKRLRRAVEPEKLRYFACGEYGSKTFRPHYHAIVFGLDIPDKFLYSVSPRGDKYYRSLWLEEIWEHGIVMIGDVTMESCAYTARYVMKKAEGIDNLFYSNLDIEPEYITMSRRPGIAFQEALKDDYNNYRVHYVGTDSGSLSFVAPRYFRKVREAQAASRLDLSYYLDRIDDSIHRDKHDAVRKELISNGTDLDYLDYLEVCEGVKQREIKSLVRNKL